MNRPALTSTAAVFLAFSACTDHSKVRALSVEESVVVTNGVRAFAADIAGDVTKQIETLTTGPTEDQC